MAIKPIQGFYVHDEDTSTDGVAKVGWDALAENDPDGVVHSRDVTNKYDKGYVTLNLAAGATVNPSPTVQNNYRYVVMPCRQGDMFRVTSIGANAARSWAFTDKNYKLYRKAMWFGSEGSYNNMLLIAEKDGYFISNATSANPYSLTYFANHFDITKNTVANYDMTTGLDYGYFDCSAGIGGTLPLEAVNSSAYRHIIIPCQKGDKFRMRGVGAYGARLFGTG